MIIVITIISIMIIITIITIILDLIRHGDKLGDPKFRSSQGKDKLG